MIRPPQKIGAASAAILIPVGVVGVTGAGVVGTGLCGSVVGRRSDVVGLRGVGCGTLCGRIRALRGGLGGDGGMGSGLGGSVRHVGHGGECLMDNNTIYTVTFIIYLLIGWGVVTSNGCPFLRCVRRPSGRGGCGGTDSYK